MSNKDSKAIVPTVTHRVRSFLAGQGVQVAPWTGLDETYADLYALLERRRDDPGFWAPVRELLASIVEAASAQGTMPASQAELLRSWDVEKLVEELRAALPDETQPSGEDITSRMRAFLRAVPAQVLGGFLVIGWVAAGCGGSVDTVGDADGVSDVPADSADTAVDSDPDTTDPDTADPEIDVPPWAVGCSLDQGSALFRTLTESSISDYSKTELCNCFADLNASWNDGLTELFSTGTPTQIAQALDEMMECCWAPYQIDNDFEDVRDAFLDGSLCWIAMPYRGVAFPPEPARKRQR